jgi:hypothetical protein
MTRSFDGNPIVTLHVPASAASGAAVPITMRVENKSGVPLELYLRGRDIAYDFIVTASDGDIVWRRLEGQIVQAILRLEALAPGQVLEFRDSWDQRDGAGKLVAPGLYTVRGTVLSDGPLTLESSAVPFRIDRE